MSDGFIVGGPTNRMGRVMEKLSSVTYESILAVLIVCVVVALSVVTSGDFWMKTNFVSVAVNSAMVGIPAIGMTLCIVTGGIDVSIGSTLGLVAAVVGIGAEMNLPTIVLVMAALATGAIVGALNGYFIAVQKIPAIIVTLGTMSVLRALVFALLGGNWITNIPSGFTNWLVLHQFVHIPYSLFLALFLVAFFAWFMRNRPWGRFIYALGNNADAASVAGIPEKRVTAMIYIVLGVLTGVAALLSLGQTPLVQSSTGEGFELTVIAAVVIGGTNILGGRGSVIGSLLGAVLVELVQDGVVLIHLPPFWNGLVLGTMILAAVLLGLVRRKESAKEL